MPENIRDGLNTSKTVYNPESDTSLPEYPFEDFVYYQPPNKEWTYGTPVDATPEGRKWMEGAKGGDTTFTIGKEDPM